MVQAVAVPVRVVAVLVSDHSGRTGTVKLPAPTVPTAPVTSSRGITTRLAFTMPAPARLPVTVTLSPTRTSVRSGEVVPGTRKCVYCETLIVQPVAVPVRVVAVLLGANGMIGPKP